MSFYKVTTYFQTDVSPKDTKLIGESNSGAVILIVLSTDVCLCNAWAHFRKSRPSYLHIASIHSFVKGMDSCFSRSKVTMTDLQIHFISFVVVSMTRWMRLKAFRTYLGNSRLHSDVV